MRGTQAAFPDTVKILALRVDFQADTLQETTGDGKFLLTPSDSALVDPPPHDKQYFDAQLQAVANYFRTVSGGKLLLQWQILPAAEREAFLLPRDMAYYAPGKDSPEADARLAELLRDAVQIADRTATIDFSDFHSYWIFHAGVGNDLNLDFDTTPNDVPSAFLSLSDLRAAFGDSDPDYRGIPVQNGQHFVEDGLILPEMESQEGIEIGLLGTATIMFGFQLGLPALFNPETGLSGIGRWGLMDQGSGNFQGLLPAEPCAWEKVYLGWEQPILVSSWREFTVAAPREPISPNKIYKIPISDTEYFLVENRQRDINHDNLAVGRDADGNRLEFKISEFGEFQIVAGGKINVITSVDEYDFGLPGSGILIWHIDEEVIRNKIAENRVNSDRERRGVDLEEADGAQDIGRFYGFLHPGSGAENGVPEDAWHADNPINKLVNNSEVVAFGPNTMPDTRSNAGANSHIRIDGFSANSSLMRFRVQNDAFVPGFPVFAGKETFPPVAAELDPGVAGKEILIGRRDGTLLAWHGNATPLNIVQDNELVDAPGKETRQYALSVFARLNAPLAAAPAIADITGDGVEEFALLLADGTLRVYTSRPGNTGVLPELLWQAAVPAAEKGHVAFAPSTGSVISAAGTTLLRHRKTGEPVYSVDLGEPALQMAVSDDRIAVLSGSRSVFINLNTGEEIAESPVAPPASLAAADMDGDGVVDYLAVSGSGKLQIFDADGALRREADFAPIAGAGVVSVGEMNGDGRKDVVIFTARALFALNAAGGMLDGFPYQFSIHDSAALKGIRAPLLLDFDADGRQEVFGAGKHSIFGVDDDGRMLPGFPIALAGESAASLAAADVDGAGGTELIAVSAGGFVQVYSFADAAAGGEHAWPFANGTAQQTRANLRVTRPAAVQGQMLPPALAYNYPNPAEGASTTIRYRLNAPATVRIKILDLAGDLVDEFSGPAVPEFDNEVQWDLRNIQSGVYLARIEASGERRTETAIFKIAVVK